MAGAEGFFLLWLVGKTCDLKCFSLLQVSIAKENEFSSFCLFFGVWPFNFSLILDLAQQQARQLQGHSTRSPAPPQHKQQHSLLHSNLRVGSMYVQRLTNMLSKNVFIILAFITNHYFTIKRMMDKCHKAIKVVNCNRGDKLPFMIISGVWKNGGVLGNDGALVNMVFDSA